MTSKIKPYKKHFDYSYAGSTFSVLELLAAKPEIVESVYIHSSFIDNCGLINFCNENDIQLIYSDKAFNLVNQKENCYVIGVFRKYTSYLSKTTPHIVLVNPSDMGNLGTIIRTAAGFNIKQLALIKPAADIFSPKTVRASMGAVFRVDFEHFDSFDEYARNYPDHQLFPFMLDSQVQPGECKPCLFSLIFGNEASGLDRSFTNVGQPVRIPFSNEINSFNLSVAAGIGMYIFASKNKLI